MKPMYATCSCILGNYGEEKLFLTQPDQQHNSVSSHLFVELDFRFNNIFKEIINFIKTLPWSKIIQELVYFCHTIQLQISDK